MSPGDTGRWNSWTWLVRQLKAAPDAVRIEAFAMHARGPGAAELLKAVREDPAVLVQDPKREIRSFRVALTSPLGTKRGRGRGAAIDSVLDAVEAFYGEVLQNLKTWTAAAPKMREVAELPKETAAALASTALSSQDGIEPAAPAGHDDAEDVRDGDMVAEAAPSA